MVVGFRRRGVHRAPASPPCVKEGGPRQRWEDCQQSKICADSDNPSVACGASSLYTREPIDSPPTFDKAVGDGALDVPLIFIRIDGETVGACIARPFGFHQMIRVIAVGDGALDVPGIFISKTGDDP